jgi:hypothetical protein
MGEAGAGGSDESRSPAGREDRQLGSEPDLTGVLDEAAALAAELAVEIGEPVSPALTNLHPPAATSAEDAAPEAAADLDEQLANLQVLVDDAAASVDTPPETAVASTGGATPPAEPVAATSDVTSPETPPAAKTGESSSPESDGGPTGVVGNMPSKPPLEPPPPPEKAADEQVASKSDKVPVSQRVRGQVSGIMLLVVGACARFLELINEPFEFIGERPRVAIGWLALGTVGASVLVAILSMLL